MKISSKRLVSAKDIDLDNYLYIEVIYYIYSYCLNEHPLLNIILSFLI